ncbi:ABC transporter ATP-binding protein [Hyphobacterium marinum]|uniref:ATP-binding cassette domain-containing protein n=1 Tax=Hyphobacterium marinum TaxID=3116574 RepID=A0ABU7LY34_9PROT|nr:ATP-binding cassette domain-containing protein [Hyphobacterium sp. Y6023]MEE2566468.1 ATP-binding cassette domain-containing protein [Hyphobacterium sp. Y6023]
MDRVIVDNLRIEYPVIDMNRSFRKEVVNTFGEILTRREGEKPAVRAIQNLSFRLQDGDRLGLVGPNGAGKSTLLRTLAGVYLPSQGHVEVVGRISTLLTTGVGMDFDDTGYDNIMTCGLLLGLSKENIEAQRDDIIEFCDLGDYIHMPMRTYSTGMMVRLSFAIATAIEPDVLLIDEVIGAGDARFSSRAADRIEKLMTKASTLVLASHSSDTIKTFCNKGLFMMGGREVFYGDVDEALEIYHKWIMQGQQAV